MQDLEGSQDDERTNDCDDSFSSDVLVDVRGGEHHRCAADAFEAAVSEVVEEVLLMEEALGREQADASALEQRLRAALEELEQLRKGACVADVSEQTALDEGEERGFLTPSRAASQESYFTASQRRDIRFGEDSAYEFRVYEPAVHDGGGEADLVAQLIASKMQVADVTSALVQARNDSAAMRNLLRSLTAAQTSEAPATPEAKGRLVSRLTGLFGSPSSASKSPASGRKAGPRSAVVNSREDAAAGVLRIERELLVTELRDACAQVAVLEEELVGARSDLVEERRLTLALRSAAEQMETALQEELAVAGRTQRELSAVVCELSERAGARYSPRKASSGGDGSLQRLRVVSAALGEGLRALELLRDGAASSRWTGDGRGRGVVMVVSPVRWPLGGGEAQGLRVSLGAAVDAELRVKESLASMRAAFEEALVDVRLEEGFGIVRTDRAVRPRGPSGADDAGDSELQAMQLQRELGAAQQELAHLQAALDRAAEQQRIARAAGARTADLEEENRLLKLSLGTARDNLAYFSDVHAAEKKKLETEVALLRKRSS